MRALTKWLSRGAEFLKGKKASRSRELTRRMIQMEQLEERLVMTGNTTINNDNPYAVMFDLIQNSWLMRVLTL